MALTKYLNFLLYEVGILFIKEMLRLLEDRKRSFISDIFLEWWVIEQWKAKLVKELTTSLLGLL